MEMKRVIGWRLCWLACCCMLLLLCTQELKAQPPVTSYTVKDGKMYITIGKNLPTALLDSFVIKYELFDLDLRQLISAGLSDSLSKRGWKIDINNRELFVLSKPLFGSDNINMPADKIIFTEKESRSIFSANQQNFGYNQFKNKSPFAVSDSVVTFFLKGYTNARDVTLAGSFNNWQPDALYMHDTDSGWIANVKLGPGKHLYKFIIDGRWSTDQDNANVENDGMGNDNSVYYKTNYTFKLDGYSKAKKVNLAGSFNNWNEKELPMQSVAGGWALPVYLPRGTHTYRFFADRKWFMDSANTERFPNEYNSYNSVVRIGNTYKFKLEGYAAAKKVELVGSFNGWKKEELFMTQTATGWELSYVLGPGNYEYKWRVDGKFIGDEITKANKVLVIEPNFTFRLAGFENAKLVTLAGDFNSWDPLSFRMTKEEGVWIFRVHLDDGKHRYKFVVDGKWILDPANKLWEQNEQKTGNSVLWIDKK